MGSIMIKYIKTKKDYQVFLTERGSQYNEAFLMNITCYVGFLIVTQVALWPVSVTEASWTCYA